MNTADIIIIGGGVMGASTAWNLAKPGVGRIVLLERDNIATGATGKSSAIVRTHYTHEVLARMSLHARRFFRILTTLSAAMRAFIRQALSSFSRPAIWKPSGGMWQ